MHLGSLIGAKVGGGGMGVEVAADEVGIYYKKRRQIWEVIFGGVG